MKAVIRYRNSEKFGDKKFRQVTFTAGTEDVAVFLKEAVRQGRISKNSYVSTVKRGRTTYIWDGSAL